MATEESESTSTPSGSGKTTLLNMIGALDTSSSGTIRVAGIDLTGASCRGRIASSILSD